MSTVFRFTTLGEAHAARSAVEAAGVRARLVDENVVAIEWLYSNAVGGVKLLVPEEQVEQAERVLTNEACDAADDALPDDPSPAGEADDAITDGRCPACGSEDLFEVPKLGVFAALSIVILGVGVAVNRPELVLGGMAVVGLALAFVNGTRCKSCGASWQSEPPAAAGEAPPPLDADTLGLSCPRCGKAELHYIRYRRLKVVPLLVPLTAVVVVPIWLLLPKKRCDNCGLRLWI